MSAYETASLTPSSPESYGAFAGNDGYEGVDHTVDTPVDEDPIRTLEETLIHDVTPPMIQAAINAVVPGGESAISDAEVILGIAAHAAFFKPADEDLAELSDRAEKIYNREAGTYPGTQSVPFEPIVFPETAEEEHRRVGEYFRDHPLGQRSTS